MGKGREGLHQSSNKLLQRKEEKGKQYALHLSRSKGKGSVFISAHSRLQIESRRKMEESRAGGSNKPSTRVRAHRCIIIRNVRISGGVEDFRLFFIFEASSLLKAMRTKQMRDNGNRKERKFSLLRKTTFIYLCPCQLKLSKIVTYISGIGCSSFGVPLHITTSQ